VHCVAVPGESPWVAAEFPGPPAPALRRAAGAGGRAGRGRGKRSAPGEEEEEEEAGVGGEDAEPAARTPWVRVPQARAGGAGAAEGAAEGAEEEEGGRAGANEGKVVVMNESGETVTFRSEAAARQVLGIPQEGAGRGREGEGKRERGTEAADARAPLAWAIGMGGSGREGGALGGAEEALGHAGHRVMAKLYDSDLDRVQVGGPHRLLRAPVRPPPRTRSPPPGASCDEGAARRQRAR